jgi:hypothetical protein
MEKKIEHDQVVDVDACYDDTCRRSIWCAAVQYKGENLPESEYCFVCAGTPRALAAKRCKITEISFCLHSEDIAKLLRHFKT